MEWNGDEHYSNYQFIQISMSCPVKYFTDQGGKTWEYRQLGEEILSEAVVILHGIKESVSSYFQLLPAIAARGYRVISVGYTDTEAYQDFPKGFNQLMLSLQVREIHFIGNDLGGFLALQLSSAPTKVFLTKSIILINSYTTVNQFKPKGIASIGLFNLFTAKSEILKDFDKAADSMTNSSLFVFHEIENLSNSRANSRVLLRKSHPYPLDLQIPEEAIMVIETMDRTIEYDPESDPHKTYPKAIYSLMKNGGDWPHLEAPSDLIQYILVHLRKWGTPMKYDEDN